ncbi:MAG: DNA-binding protein WhiA, partial [Senegalimassilia faecalis]
AVCVRGGDGRISRGGKNCEKLLHARGHVYPSTLDRVSLVARTRDGRYIEGQAVACHSRTALAHVQLRSAGNIVAYPPALEAIRNADLIVLGPGSLFTSIIPNLLVPGVIDAIRQSRGATLFVCSLADMQGETWGLTAREHVEALMEHGMRGLLDYVLVHSAVPIKPDSSETGVFRAVTGANIGASRFVVDDETEQRRVRPVRIDYADLRLIQSKGPVVNRSQPCRPRASHVARSVCIARGIHGGVASMSFTAEVKDELARVPAVCSHCDKAVLAALVRIEGTLFVSGKNRYRVEIATDAPSVARQVIKLLHELYQLKTNLTVRRSVLHKTPNYLIEAPAQPNLAPALLDMGVLSPEGGLVLGISDQLVAKDCCAAAYLRGAFLGSGFVSDPRGDFHFEIIVESESLPKGLSA